MVEKYLQEKQKYSEISLSHYHFSHNETHTGPLDIETELPQ
jgi:hypothetical protein